MNPQALVVQKRTLGIPSSWDASRVKLMTPSETMAVIGGIFLEQLSLEIRLLNGAKQFFIVDAHREGMSWVASSTFVVGGRPSGIVSNLKEWRALGESGVVPQDLRRRFWLNSVFTKVI